MQLAPFPAVIPLLVAALLTALSEILPRRLIDLIACATSACVFGACCYLVHVSEHTPIVYWFGGWAPVHGFPIGISFVIDPIGAGLAAFVALLVTGSFIFSWYYFESVKSLFHALMLVFLAGMCGLALTGDLFNLFVWFELMSAAGIALCGYKSEETGPLQGAINFGVTNTLGAYLTLTGIAILYSQTQALNMAQVGASLVAQNPGDVLILIAFIFLASGFLVKSAAFPFHFWLADAHAVAPTPVCILFSGVMVELGLYAVTRIYWTIFAQSLAPYVPAVRQLFLIIGILTALVGGIGCFSQRHLKRLLAFSTISHMGVMIMGFGLLEAGALAGTALYVLGHGMVKAALFICAGILLNRFQSVDEFDLQGIGKQARWTGMLMVIGAIGLAGVPTFGNFFGEAKIEDSLQGLGLSGLKAVIMISGILTAGAVLRIWARIFMGWGERRADHAEGAPKIPMERETEGQPRQTPWTMWTPAFCLLALSVGIALSGSLRHAIEDAAYRLQDLAAYQRLVLQGHVQVKHIPIAAEEGFPPFWRELLTAVIAILLAAAALFPSVLGSMGDVIMRMAAILLRPFRAIHSGRVGDYVAWFIFGIAAYGGFLLLRAQ